jgi:hypothetical protein
MDNTIKKGRGRPLKNEEDKLIGRRISLTSAEWEIIDYLCDKNAINPGDLMVVLANDLEVKDSYENQNN